MPELSLAEILLRVSLAGALGAAVGLERELRDREAGLRTHLLVAVGSALFTLVSAYGWSLWGAIQASASDIDHDFDSWGRERFEKAARGFSGDRFPRLLEEAASDD